MTGRGYRNIDTVLSGDGEALFEERNDGILDDLAVFLVHFQFGKNNQGFVNARFDGQETVLKTAGVDKNLADGNQVLVGLSGFVEIAYKLFAFLAAQFFVSVANQKGFFRLCQIT